MDTQGSDEAGVLTKRGRRPILSPLRLVLALAAGVFVIETFLMAVFWLLPMHPALEFVLDSSLLIVCLSPILYWYLFQPLIHLIEDYRAQERELKAYQEQLKGMVAERTRELDQTVQGLQHEVAERRQVEMALRESDARFRQLFDQSEDANVLVAPDTLAITDVNATAAQCFGSPREDLVGAGIAAFFHTQSLAELGAAVDTIRGQGASSRLQRLVTRDEQAFLSMRGKMINLQGEALMYLGFRDVTREVRLEEEAREIQGRLIHANRMTSLGMLVASVAHEINNPNNYILINAGLLKQSWQDILPVLRARFETEGDFPVGRTTFSKAEEFIPEATDGIIDGAHRIGMIVGNLRDLGRDDPASRMGNADLNQVVRLSSAILDHHISRFTHRFRLELCEDPPPQFSGNARQMEQVVINLIMNALQSLSGPGQGVVVSTAIEPGQRQVVLRVADEGCGIQPEIAARIMDPFFTTRVDQGGTGLGLSISAAIVRDQGGTMDFSSVPGEGTVFTVRLQQPEAVDSAREEPHHDR